MPAVRRGLLRWPLAVGGRGAERAPKEVCPACHRSNDKFPAGEITLSGPFFESHRDEILGLVRNTQEDQNAEHPLSRIIDIVDNGDTSW